MSIGGPYGHSPCGTLATAGVRDPCPDGPGRPIDGGADPAGATGRRIGRDVGGPPRPRKRGSPAGTCARRPPRARAARPRPTPPSARGGRPGPGPRRGPRRRTSDHRHGRRRSGHIPGTPNPAARAARAARRSRSVPPDVATSPTPSAADRASSRRPDPPARSRWSSGCRIRSLSLPRRVTSGRTTRGASQDRPWR
jgi:hypothetical protein